MRNLTHISGGNQRELARQKNQKKLQQMAKQKRSKEKDGNKGASMEARKLRWVRFYQVGGKWRAQ